MASDRLPKNVEPIHYDLVLRTDLEEKAYYGAVNIALVAREDTSTVTLHVCDPIRLGQVREWLFCGAGCADLRLNTGVRPRPRHTGLSAPERAQAAHDPRQGCHGGL